MKLMPPKKSSGPGEIQETTANLSEIRFYRANEKPFGAFSNLFLRAVEFDGDTY